LCTPSGRIYHYQPATGEMTPIIVKDAADDIFARAMICIDNEIWLGTQNGLYVINMINGSQIKLQEGNDGKSNLSNSTIYTLYADRDGNAWVGTMYGGVNFFQRNGFRFDRYSSGKSDTSLPSKRIRGLTEDADGIIYIGSEEAGFTTFNPRTGNFKVLNNKDISLMIKTFRDTVYLGKVRTGMDVIVDGKVIENRFTSLHGVDEQNSVYSFLVDGQGNKWVGSDWGLFRAFSGKNEYAIVPELDQAWIFDIMQDSKGMIWFATMGGGIWKYNPSNDKFTHYPYDEKASNGLRSNSISAIKEDSRGYIWFSTDRGGLVKYNPAGDNFITISEEHGLPDNVVYDILEDSKGFLWFGTNRGLVKYHPETGHVKVFTTADGLLSNQFNYHSALASKDGWFYFGTMEGLIAFNPEIDTYNDSVPEIFFTSLRSSNKEIKPGAESSPLIKSILYTDKIKLPHDFTPLIFEVSAPSYVPQGTLDYTYRCLLYTTDAADDLTR
ncbi:MAG: hybrid sensor histidine kinase/response regulator, partial [Muribaculaceae bacterium]|nr:hybrid sensor histidine kinase/response regulator [Muribaculaceae bacterium]